MGEGGCELPVEHNELRGPQHHPGFLILLLRFGYYAIILRNDLNLCLLLVFAAGEVRVHERWRGRDTAHHRSLPAVRMFFAPWRSIGVRADPVASSRM